MSRHVFWRLFLLGMLLEVIGIVYLVMLIL